MVPVPQQISRMQFTGECAALIDSDSVADLFSTVLDFSSSMEVRYKTSAAGVFTWKKLCDDT